MPPGSGGNAGARCRCACVALAAGMLGTQRRRQRARRSALRVLPWRHAHQPGGAPDRPCIAGRGSWLPGIGGGVRELEPGCRLMCSWRYTGPLYTTDPDSRDTVDAYIHGGIVKATGLVTPQLVWEVCRFCTRWSRNLALHAFELLQNELKDIASIPAAQAH